VSSKGNIPEGAPPLSRFVRQGGGFDFLFGFSTPVEKKS
jgi:hypothetical protein